MTTTHARTANEQQIASLEAQVVSMRGALKRCSDLFSSIRGDWTDPRSECREGWAVIDAALSTSTEYANKVVVDREELRAMEACLDEARLSYVSPNYYDLEDRLDSLRKQGGGK